jgi:hypothetical protein
MRGIVICISTRYRGSHFPAVFLVKNEVDCLHVNIPRRPAETVASE